MRRSAKSPFLTTEQAMPIVLPKFRGYTVYNRLREFRKIEYGQLPEFIPFESPKGRRLLKEIESLATMPSKEEIYSKLLFLLNAPAQRLVTAMNAVGRNLAVVVNQGVQEKKFKDAATSS